MDSSIFLWGVVIAVNTSLSGAHHGDAIYVSFLTDKRLLDQRSFD